jgi:hypothetical protein
MTRKIALCSLLLTSAFLSGAALETARAATVPVTFTQLPGLAGGTLAATGVFVADLTSPSFPLGQIASVTITDNGSTAAGSPGQFSGFDLDAIVLSTTLIVNASQVGTLVNTGPFNFATSFLVGGSQTAPADPALFGTSGGQVNNAVATLGVFDGESTTAIPGADGFVSLGVGGVLSIDLIAALAAGGSLYLYVGEVGNNDEVLLSGITV